jgi:hypothetical protein
MRNTTINNFLSPSGFWNLKVNLNVPLFSPLSHFSCFIIGIPIPFGPVFLLQHFHLFLLSV